MTDIKSHFGHGHPFAGEEQWRDLTPLMKPTTVAVVGASQREARGNTVIRNLVNMGFPGKIFPINPKYDDVLGLQCYPDLAATPERADCVVVAIPARHVPDLLEAAVDIGVRATVILSSGFGEGGPEGRTRQEKLEALSEGRGLLVCGPNCWGVLNVFDKVPIFGIQIQPNFATGNVGLVSQSGGLSLVVAMPMVENLGIGFSYIVSCGNQAGTTVEEYMNYLVEDNRTQVVAAFVEGFKKPERLAAVAQKALDKRKPIIVMKVGKSEAGRQATLAHSGSLAGEAEVVEAVLRQSGIVQVNSLNEMVETINLFSCSCFVERFSGGKRIGMLSGTGGECSHVADVAEEVGLELPDLAEITKANLRNAMPEFASPRNPLDGTGAMFEDPKLFPQLLRGLLGDPNLDMAAVNIVANDSRPVVRANNVRFAKDIAGIAADAKKPVAAFSAVAAGALDQEIILPLRSAGVPFLQGTEFAMKAFHHLVCYHRFRETERFKGVEPIREMGAFTLDDFSPGVLPTEAAFRLLEAWGIPVAQTRLARTAEEAVSIANQFGFPVAMKIESPAIQHKNDVGGVVLHVDSSEAVRHAFLNIKNEVSRRVSKENIVGVIVQSMADRGVEMILGIKRDAVFGPAILCGLGGLFVETLRDVTVAVPPVSKAQAYQLIRRLRGWPILAGSRGHQRADSEALSDVIVKFSHLAYSQRNRIAALDINPLMVYPEGRGVLAVDALVQIQ